MPESDPLLDGPQAEPESPTPAVSTDPTPEEQVRELMLDPSFLDQDFQRRTQKVRLFEVEEYRRKIGTLKENEQLNVLVHAISADEYFKAREAASTADDWKKLRDVYIEKTQHEVPAALKAALQKAENSVGQETVLRIELILRAARDEDGKPLMKRTQIVTLAEYFMTDFLTLSNAILDMRGEGPKAGE